MNQSSYLQTFYMRIYFKQKRTGEFMELVLAPDPVGSICWLYTLINSINFNLQSITLKFSLHCKAILKSCEKKELLVQRVRTCCYPLKQAINADENLQACLLACKLSSSVSSAQVCVNKAYRAHRFSFRYSHSTPLSAVIRSRTRRRQRSSYVKILITAKTAFHRDVYISSAAAASGSGLVSGEVNTESYSRRLLPCVLIS